MDLQFVETAMSCFFVLSQSEILQPLHACCSWLDSFGVLSHFICKCNSDLWTSGCSVLVKGFTSTHVEAWCIDSGTCSGDPETTLAERDLSWIAKFVTAQLPGFAR